MTSCSKELKPGPHPKTLLEITTRTAERPDFKFELFPLHSPLLGESLLVSFPPLIDMLKFSGEVRPGATSKATPSSASWVKPITLKDRSLDQPSQSNSDQHGEPRKTKTKLSLEVLNDAQTGMLPGIPGSAMCVQRFDDSLNSAIHITYRISLRSSSMWEPRDPLLKVLFLLVALSSILFQTANIKLGLICGRRSRSSAEASLQVHKVCVYWPPKQHFNNDPSAGSPTETLLRLLLPLNDQV
ncbi:hypothetical protein G7K_1410-t1 [Saitoella complicata NRRL Y-17804]|uniref:Uncharacterized protein n=1 Tax=Saitoella complicata (strain BCRC 22490 / CBS 7301 / JCM 7358 / NBRC 10748 / NRRL Y-17804) TaxID=698492 RepID=A0A0E9NCQ7_SAICN|nr:hypothetical protein G7K_1410-t1 [Saitoella complicata NRRL Y-17804]